MQHMIEVDALAFGCLAISIGDAGNEPFIGIFKSTCGKSIEGKSTKDTITVYKDGNETERYTSKLLGEVMLYSVLFKEEMGIE